MKYQRKQLKKTLKMSKELKNFTEITNRNIIINGRNDLKRLIRNALIGFVKDAGT